MPATKQVNIGFRWSDYELLENWRRAQPEIPSVAATIRTFVLQGLKDDERHPKTAAYRAKSGDSPA
jgi:hypothetical protein